MVFSLLAIWLLGTASLIAGPFNQANKATVCRSTSCVNGSDIDIARHFTEVDPQGRTSWTLPQTVGGSGAGSGSLSAGASTLIPDLGQGLATTATGDSFSLLGDTIATAGSASSGSSAGVPVTGGSAPPVASFSNPPVSYSLQASPYVATFSAPQTSFGLPTFSSVILPQFFGAAVASFAQAVMPSAPVGSGTGSGSGSGSNPFTTTFATTTPLSPPNTAGSTTPATSFFVPFSSTVNAGLTPDTTVNPPAPSISNPLSQQQPLVAMTLSSAAVLAPNTLSTPEPGMLLLAGSGLVLLGLAGKSKRKR